MKRLLSLLLALLLCVSLPVSAAFADEPQIPGEEPENPGEEPAEETEAVEPPPPQETVRIRSEQEFTDFAASCGIDSWSLNRRVYLLADLDFTGIEFTPVPVFCGTFYGGGHSITGLKLDSDGSHAGVFRYIQQSGTVKGLDVSGTVTPGGTAVCVGGIAGTNSGLIENCSFSGTVSGLERIGGIAGENAAGGTVSRCSFSGSLTGEHMAGGITGFNEGTVSACENNSSVNNVRISVSGSFSFDISEITTAFSTEEFLNITDIGGIAGCNTGTLLDCVNSGGIGYNRMGYNVGGIAGRSSGCVSGCRNTGTVKGRKDVGGIAGQLEPYTFWSFSKSKLEELGEQIQQLDGLASSALKNSDGYSRQMKNTLLEFSNDLKSAVSELDPILGSVSTSADNVSSAIDEIKKIASSDGSGNPTPSDIGSLISGSDPDKLDQISDIANGIKLETPDFDPLIYSLGSVADSGSRLTSILTDYAGTLTGSLSALLEQANSIYAGFTDTAEYLKSLDGDYTQDISAEALDEFSTGSVSGCVNSADVSAETNAGGIVGAAAVEFSFDAEDELNISDYLFTDPNYMIYAVIRNCESFADVSAVKSCAGGTVGRMDFGAAGMCTAAGEISVSSGDYGGGIAGKSSGTLISCCSRVRVSAKKYAGGTAGEGCEIKDCRAYAYISGADEYFGSVAGSVSGECSGNYFVKNGINAIDNISYSGIAEPLEYQEMTALEDIPDMFRDITVTFTVEGEVFESITVPFGGSIDELPAVPSKDDMYWKWDSFDAETVYYSMTVEGRYCSPITTLTTAEDPPLFLAQGSFYEGQQLQTVPYSPDSEKLGIPADQVISACTLNISDCKGTLTFRMRASSDLRLFRLNEDGSYSRLDFEADGSYIVFTAPNGSTVVLAKEIRDPAAKLKIIIPSAVALSAIVLYIILRRRKHKKNSQIQ